VHLLVHDPEICATRCTVEYANPCERFCPAAVYEMVDDPASPHGRRLQINASNCVHCKTCDIQDPYQIITWVPPEGGGGPNYGRMCGRLGDLTYDHRPSNPFPPEPLSARKRHG
jgi:electron-transferring-flavoprotein dehydrogenase